MFGKGFAGRCSGRASRSLVGANFAPFIIPELFLNSGILRIRSVAPPLPRKAAALRGFVWARLCRQLFGKGFARRSKLRSARNPLCASRSGDSSPRFVAPPLPRKACALRGFARARLRGLYLGRASRALLGKGFAGFAWEGLCRSLFGKGFAGFAIDRDDVARHAGSAFQPAGKSEIIRRFAPANNFDISFYSGI